MTPRPPSPKALPARSRNRTRWALCAGLLALGCTTLPAPSPAPPSACISATDELANWTVARLFQPERWAPGVSVLGADDWKQAVAGLPAPRGRAGYAIGLVRTDRGTHAKFRFRLQPGSGGSAPRLELTDVYVVEGGVFRPTYTRFFELDLREDFDFDALLALDEPDEGDRPGDLRFAPAPRHPRLEAPAGSRLFFPTGSQCHGVHARR